MVTIENFGPPLAVSIINKREKDIGLVNFGMRGLAPTEKKQVKIHIVILMVFLFVCACTCQTLAWYHNVDEKYTFWVGFMISMVFVLGEYLFLLPSNNLGYKMFSTMQLAIMIEVIAWTVFIIYVKFFRKEEITRNCWIGLGIMSIGVIVAYL